MTPPFVNPPAFPANGQEANLSIMPIYATAMVRVASRHNIAEVLFSPRTLWTTWKAFGLVETALLGRVSRKLGSAGHEAL